MKKFVISALMSFLASTSFSANNIFIKGNVLYTNENVKVLFDFDKKETLKKIDQAIFVKSPNKNLNFGFYNGRFWAKFKVDSLFDAPQILEIKNPVIDQIRLYRRVGNTWILQGKIGDVFKFSEREIKHRFPQFSIKSKGEYLLRIECKGDLLALKMNLFSPNQIKKRDYRLQVLAGMYFGILCIVLLFNLFMYILLRGRNNLILIFFLLSMILFELSLTGYGFEWIWGEYPYLQNSMIPWTGAMYLLLIIRFLVNYLKIKRISIRTYRVLNVSSVVVLVNFVLSFFNNGQVNIYIYTANNLISLVLIFAVIPIVIAAVRNRFKSSRLVLFSFIGLTAGVIIAHLNYYGLITNFFIDNINIQFGVLFQAVFLTFAVLDGYKIFKDKSNQYLKEISRLKEEQILKLESKVGFRTIELVEQKEQLERVNRDIISSITYANRIQSALIPNEKTFLKNFKNGFLSFRPKEIVSGDFYWSCKINDENEKGETVEKIVVCVGDTNAQGVPGSMLSVLTLRVIQSCIYKKSVTSPGKLLDIVNDELKNLFPKLEESKEKVNGIYCTICVIDDVEKSVEFAGAMGRIYVRNNNELIQYKGDNRLLGKGTANKNFQSKKIQLAQSDIIYLGTDGYKNQLQFIKESKEKDIIDVLNKYAYLPIEKQKTIYIKEYDDMVKRHGQLDDFCIIGIEL